jgi:hypothetical protein
MAEEKAAKKEDKSIKTIVVPQLPNVPTNIGRDEDGNDVNLMSMDEALTEILDIARALKKGLL